MKVRNTIILLTLSGLTITHATYLPDLPSNNGTSMEFCLFLRCIVCLYAARSFRLSGEFLSIPSMICLSVNTRMGLQCIPNVKRTRDAGAIVGQGGQQERKGTEGYIQQIFIILFPKHELFILLGTGFVLIRE